jgi:hypothetical protein
MTKPSRPGGIVQDLVSRRATVDRAPRSRRGRRPEVVALIAVALGLAAAVLPGGAAAHPSAQSPSAGRALHAAGCRLYGNADDGYWSECFPAMHVDISWDGYSSVGEDKGSYVGTQATFFEVYKHVVIVGNEQSSKLHDRASITGGLYADCGDEATPDYDGHGKGLLESNVYDDSVVAWSHDRPRKNVDWGPNVAGFPVTMSNCDGGTYPAGYAPGTPPFGGECPADPRTHPEFELYYGKYSGSGSITAGRRETWDFNCTFSGATWTSTGQMTMTENACPRITHGLGYAKLSKATKAVLKRFYKALDDQGGCYRFRSGWTSKSTHAQNADIVVGFRPLGLEAFAKTLTLQKYVVPILRDVAEGVGLCGPTSGDPGRYQLPYKTGHEKEPSCHIG